ncbi:MAG: type II secretion system secretin GspD [Pseudomonadota bacterium]
MSQQHSPDDPNARRTSRATRSGWALAIVLLLVSPGADVFSQTGDDQYFTPNFVGVDVQDVIKIVANETGRSFIVDARVKGPVTFFGAPMPSDALYEAFLAMLQVNGFVAIPSGNVVKVLPDTNARQLPSTDLPTTLSDRSDEIVTHVIRVNNVGAAQLVPILRPLVPQYGHLAAHPASNMLIISDREANVYRLTRIIQRIDRDSDEEIEVITLEHATAGELVRVLTALNQAGARAADGSSQPVSLIADERTNSILVSGERTERLRYRTLIAHLDTPLETGGNTQVIYLRYADAEELAGRLTEQVNQQQQQNRTGGGGGQAQAGGGGGGSPAQRGGVIIWADAATNALVITAPPKVMRSLQAVIDQLDIRRAQVVLDAIIVDVSADRSAELGVTWITDATSTAASAGATNFRSSGNSIVDVAGAVAAADGSVPADASGLVQDGLTFGLGRIREGGTSFAALLTALEGDARTNILSYPTITTLDNEEAELSVGQQVPFLTGSFSNTGANQGAVNPFQTIQRQDVGLTLKVTPQINEGDAVILDIELEVSSLSQGSAGAVDLITNRRTITQKVIVEDGGVVVMGGLIDESLTESEQRVPVLGRLPLLKNLFRARTAERNKRNLMVFVQPRILRDAEAAALATNEKYTQVRGQTIYDRKGGLLGGETPPSIPPLIDLRTRGISGALNDAAAEAASPAANP